MRPGRNGPPHATIVVALATALLIPLATATLPLLDEGPKEYSTVPVTPWPETGERFVLLFSLTNPLGANVTLVELETLDGLTVTRVYARYNTLYITDSSAPPGPNGRVQSLSATLGDGPHRLDVGVDGATATVVLDQRSVWQVAVGTFNPATAVKASEAFPLVDRPGLIVHRSHFATGGAEHSFTRSLPSLGWTEHDPEGGRVTARATYQGGHSLGVLDIWTGLTTASLIGHASTVVPAHEGRYRAIVTFIPDSRPEPAVGLAVLAGIAGPADHPEVAWAIIPQRDDVLELSWRLDLWLPSGAVTPIFGPWQALAWHDIDVLIDVDANTLTIALDGGSEAKRFEVQDLATVERVAVGDVFGAPRIEDLTAQMWYDDVAVIPVP